ncbi:hypothetical protein [Spirillospora sp. NPDC048824]|uniref:hypothetical protein n=1 Tax=Spirillospora sp. NPDC048824 TaxID=3364526 RepID=UPI003720D6A1
MAEVLLFHHVQGLTHGVRGFADALRRAGHTVHAPDAARALVSETAGAELFLYPGDRHLFTDSSLPSYDGQACALLLRRFAAFLAALP